MGRGPKRGGEMQFWGCENNRLDKSDNNFRKIYEKIESRPAVNLFLLHFYF